MTKKVKKEKELLNNWEEVDKDMVDSLVKEFKTLYTVYCSQQVDGLAIATAFLTVGQWAMNKEIGLQQTQDLLKLLAHYKYEVAELAADKTIH
jgi:hypothetical protein